MPINTKHGFEINKTVDRYLENRNIELFSISIFDILKKYGYVFINQPSSYELFCQIGNTLGTVIHSDDIKVQKNGDYAAYRSSEIFPHTDTADAHIMGWWCEKQDRNDGTSILIDTHNLFLTFEDNEINVLKNTKLFYPSENHRTKDSFLKFDEVPLVYDRWGQLKLNYAPWLDLVPSTDIEKIIIEKFKINLQKAIEKDAVKIRLKERQLLFIDNGRFLHSRKNIDENSKRCLKRLWIKTGDCK